MNKTTNERYARRTATVSNDESFMEEGSFDETLLHMSQTMTMIHGNTNVISNCMQMCKGTGLID
jgi:hypothetical protein